MWLTAIVLITFDGELKDERNMQLNRSPAISSKIQKTKTRNIIVLLQASTRHSDARIFRTHCCDHT